MSLLHGLRIVATGSYLPPKVVTNVELSEHLDTSDEWITARTGIRERRYADEAEPTSELATKACRAALERAGIDAREVDHLVCATSTPDWPQPATAAAIHGMLGMSVDAGAMDVDAVCTGFVYALHAAAAQLVAEPTWDYVLVVGADCYSRILDREDRTTSVFFGDGAGAVLLGRVPELPDEEEAGRPPRGILSSVFGNDFSLHDAIIVPAGGSREPITTQAIANRRQYFHMNGPAVFEFATSALPKAIQRACQQAGLDPSEIDLLVPHQSNRRIIEASMQALRLPPERTHYTLEAYGNTAAASIPVTLDDAIQKDRIRAGDLVAIAGYGGGLSWGSLLIRW